MKKLIFSTALILTMIIVSYGKPANKNTNLVKGLTTALQSSQSVSTVTTSLYKHISFTFNGKIVSAYYDVESQELIGFSIPMSVTDLPQGAADNLATKFSHYSADAMMMFVLKNGYFTFYVSLSHPGKPSIVADVSANGSVHYFGKIIQK